MRHFFTLISVLLLMVFVAKAQKPDDAKNQAKTETEKKIGVKFSGYILYDAFYDTREFVDARDGDFMLYPANHSYDKNGVDINDEPTLNMLSIQTRLRASITGPDAFGGKTRGLIESDYMGRSQDFISHIRLRHAYMAINWSKFELLMGQTWHPMFVPEVSPSTLTFAVGVPIMPLNRGPQVRATYNFTDKVQIIGALISQRDYANVGNAEMLRKSATPDMQLQIKIGDAKTFLFGATLGYKTLKPRDITDLGYKTTKTISSFNTSVFMTLNTRPFKLKAMYVYGENMSNHVMIGGFAKKYSKLDIDDYDYTNLITNSAWMDISSNTEKVKFGLFAGCTSILGSVDEIDPSVMYARGGNIDYLFRVAPRIIFSSGKIDLGFEPTFDQVAYASKYGSERNVLESSTIEGWRFLFLAKYSF